MSVRERRARERTRRERLIVTTARDLAESEGWDAVTTRRLAELIEYSQPVLYSHFRGKGAIMAAVAVEGFAEIADRLRAARAGARTGRAALAAVVAAYLDFAERHPALYDAMFVHAVDLRFAHPETPAALREAFGTIRDAVRPFAGDDDLDVHTEVFWAGLHGIVTLMRGDRLPRETQDRRIALFLDRFAG
ncbi:TetR/AcrR family transcriptional regulator [Plantactinospora sp. KBS50]|uniref:TetR/AcrR family transcriptional regulator n=1 Tax=Plantactinospora sp. KBS50 TaxID=2024580 RepID=UPI000BAAD24A|nr:TetR/AcrR family transcriptional regulator [Plantactinospora sp. KBS50]ASW55132.1 TetR family transcriptional regulator [Plantactinospora sp. KBS50]